MKSITCFQTILAVSCLFLSTKIGTPSVETNIAPSAMSQASTDSVLKTTDATLPAVKVVVAN